MTEEFDGENIRATTAQNDTCFMTPGGTRTYTVEAAERPAPEVQVRAFASWMLCKWTVFAVAVGLWLFIAATLLTTACIEERADRLAVRLTAVGGVKLYSWRFWPRCGVCSGRCRTPPEDCCQRGRQR